MPRISAVINTRNEENNIGYCLESVKWCDEIVVVDMESEDRTIEIVREYTDKVYSHEKVLAFDVARKFAAERASGDWILLVDADELVPKALARRLREVADKDEADAVQIPFKNILLGRWNRFTGWWPDYHCRFFKSTVMDFSEHVHAYQHLRDSARTLYCPAEERYAIHHFAYTDVRQFIDKLNRYTTIEAHHLYDEKRPFRYVKVFTAGLGEFYNRYISCRGYKDGARGLFVSLMMGMYRMISYVKLWELYENETEPVIDKYARMKKELLAD
jgi:glycosyltransferase involved in cell wall biosynthesis